MRRAICPGSFDPVTLGHVDIFERAAAVFDELYIGVFSNVRKKPMFSVEERSRLLAEATKHLPNVKIVAFDGLLANYMLQHDIGFIVRGLRSVTDYEYEQGQAQLIKAMHPQLDTMFLLGRPEYNSYGSSVVRELLNFGGDIAPLVPQCVADFIKNR